MKPILPGGWKPAPDRAQREAALARLRVNIDPQDFLQDLGATNIRQEADQLIHSCLLPFGLHKHGDRSASAAFNVDLLKYNCFVCGGGDIFWLLATVKDISIAEALETLLGEAEADVTAFNFAAMLRASWESDKESSLVEMPRYSERIIQPWLRVSPYLLERGVSEHTQQHYCTGVDLKHREKYEQGNIDEWIERPRLVIPHFYGGYLRGWQKRKLDSIPYGAKYLSSKGFPRAQTLFGYDHIDTRKVIVVESPMSVLRLHSLGYENVLATMGAEVTTEQLDLLAAFDTVHVFMDADKAGDKATRDLVDGLHERTHMWVMEIECADTDPADYDRSAIDEMYERAVPSIVWLLERKGVSARNR